MKTYIKYIYILITAFVLNSCAMEEPYNTVSFQEVECTALYDPGRLKQMIITSKGDFDKTFETTGTPIDFSTHFVVAIIHPSTQKETTMKISTVLNKEQSLVVKYVVKYGKEQTKKTLPNAVVAIERGYINCDIAIFDVSDLEY